MRLEEVGVHTQVQPLDLVCSLLEWLRVHHVLPLMSRFSQELSRGGVARLMWHTASCPLPTSDSLCRLWDRSHERVRGRL